MNDYDEERPVTTRMTSTVTEEDIFGTYQVEKKQDWGYREGERIWLGRPEDRPVEEYTVTYGSPEKDGAYANDNFVPVIFH